MTARDATISSSTLPAAPVEVAVPKFDDARAALPKFPGLSDLLNYLDQAEGRIELTELERLLSELKVSRSGLVPACCFSDRAYKRNTIARTEWFELVCLCWRSGQVTPIHDHTGSSCAFRVVEGVGTEVRFRRSPAGLVIPEHSTQMAPGYVCAAQDDDIHQVCNSQAPGTDLITLHIYSPPIQQMHVYPFAAVCENACACPIEAFDPIV